MPTPPDAPATLRARLRAETAAGHRALETALDLLDGHTDPRRMRRLLARFHGFHAVWEPALAARLDAPADFLAARARLPALRADLLALGLDAAAIDTLPRCEAARELAASPAAAFGSLYVLEGSTLGGQLITRGLATLPWWPAGGLRYFDPHGHDTGRRWRETVALLDTAAPPSHDTVVASAQATFGLLQGWLVLPSYSVAGPPAA